MKKHSFDLDWDCTDEIGMIPAMYSQWKPVKLPHDAAIYKPRSANAPSGSMAGFAWSGVVTYRKQFEAPEEWRTQSVSLEFEGVYVNAEVSINGQLVALHPYGYTSFLVELTPYLRYGGDNLLVVVANNSAQPNARWYSGTGIYRHVWLRTGGALHIKPWGVFVTTPVVDPANSTVRVATELSGPTAGATLRSTLLDRMGKSVAKVETPVTGLIVE
jgi:beta-galactosidase